MTTAKRKWLPFVIAGILIIGGDLWLNRTGIGVLFVLAGAVIWDTVGGDDE